MPDPAVNEEWKEPTIVINGVMLPRPAAITMRVAISAFAFSLEDGLGDDEHGKFMTEAYKKQIKFIQTCMNAM